MNVPLLFASPGITILFKWSCLLALGWAAHWAFRYRHARWRLILWRSILCFGLLLPLLQFFQVPGIKIPIPSDTAPATEVTSPVSTASTANMIQPATTVVKPAQIKTVGGLAFRTESAPQSAAPQKPILWGGILLMIWALGFIVGFVRLVRLHFQLSCLRNKTCPMAPELQQLTKQIRTRLNVREEVEVQISDSVASPFVCGLLKPTIILPRMVLQHFSLNEMSALLSHEIAHLRQHDLLWCVAWRWMKAVCWFHPFVWKIPAAHNLACEQEADRIASGQLADQDSYPRLLAQLALRVLALPAVETRLTVNGSSQIARRLNHLGQTGIGAWNWRHSVAGFCLVGLLFLVTAGCEFSRTASSGSVIPTNVEFKKVLVVVKDEDGKPIEGATVLPTGFRVKGIHGADAYGWNKKLFGPPEKAVTDGNGKAYGKTHTYLDPPGICKRSGAELFSGQPGAADTIDP